MKIVVKKVKGEEVKNFSKKEWGIVNKKFNMLPSTKTFYFAARQDKRIIGYYKMQIRGGICEIRELLVENNFRDKGIGSLMMKNIEKLAKKEKCKKIFVKTPSIFKESLNFYKKHGFKKNTIIHNYCFSISWYYLEKTIVEEHEHK